MKSTILTKINETPLQFKDQMSELCGEGDFNFLKQFVNYMHPKADVVTTDNHLDAFTSKGAWQYHIYPRYIMRVDRNKATKKFYKIS